jgi:hypothetical protein
LWFIGLLRREKRKDYDEAQRSQRERGEEKAGLKPGLYMG